MFDETIWCSICSRRGRLRDGNAVETAGKAGQRADVRVDRRATVVLEQIVVDVNPIHGGAGGVHLVEKGEVVVYEVG